MATRRGEVPEYARVDLVDRLHKSLRYARLKPGAMAQYLGVHRNTVGSYLRGSVRPDTRTLRLWAMRCGVPYEWLADGRIDLTDGPWAGVAAPPPPPPPGHAPAAQSPPGCTDS